jgi:hypothetical protein
LGRVVSLFPHASSCWTTESPGTLERRYQDWEWCRHKGTIMLSPAGLGL